MNSTAETVFGCLMGIIFLAIWITPIPLGIRQAKRKHRSPHWMWFGLHPMSGWIAFIVLYALPPLKECPNCGENAKAHARVCPFCLTSFEEGSIPQVTQTRVQAPDPISLEQKYEKALKSSLLIGRIIVSVLCFGTTLLYLLVYTLAVLKGNPSGFAVGYARIPFNSPPLIVLLVLSALTFIGVLVGLTWYQSRASLKAKTAVIAHTVSIGLASALLETVAIYGLVLGFMFGPDLSTLTLTLACAVIVGGVLIFPRASRSRGLFDRGLQAALSKIHSPTPAPNL